MSRRGLFGRAPRPALSLSNTIVSIARQFQATRDQNLMDAWSKGGIFEGKKATDEMVLAHWKERKGQVAKDDPLYDTYNNAYMEYDYSIHESKETARYALIANPSAADDRHMASFYLNWAKKVPKNSEFYRVLQRDAGQFMRAASAKGKANSARFKEEKYQADMQALHDKHEAAGEYITDTLKQLAQRGSRDGSVQQLIAGPGTNSDLTDFDPTDPEGILRLLDSLQGGELIKTHSRDKGNPSVLMYDDMGKPVTGDDILAKFNKLRHAGAGSGPVDLTAIQDAIRSKQGGLQQRIALATKTGHASDVNALRKEMTYTSELGRQIAAWPVEEAYMHRREQFMQIMQDPQASAYNKQQAVMDYRADLSKMADDPRIKTNDRFINSLKGEAQGNEAALTLSESFTGMVNPDGTSQNKDVARTNFEFETATVAIKNVESGAAVWTTGEIDNNGIFHAGAGGSRVGAATPGEISAASGGVQPRFVYVPDGSGTPRRVMVMGQDIMATAISPDGTKVAGPNVPVAQAYVVNGKTIYGFKINGADVFSSDPPWDPAKARMVPTAGGFDLDLSQAAKDAYAAPNLAGTGFAFKPGANGKNILTVDPQVAAFATDPSHNKGGFDPNTDFASPSLAFLNSTYEGQRALTNLVKDDMFNAQLEDDMRKSAGFSQDPTTGAYVGGKDDLYQRAAGQAALTVQSSATGGQNWWADTSALLDRTRTGNQLSKDDREELAQRQAAVLNGAPDLSKLATSVLAGLDTGWSALASQFMKDTLNVKPQQAGQSGPSITLSNMNIKVPGDGMAKKAGTTGPVAPTPTPTPTTTNVSITPTWDTAQSGSSTTPAGSASGYGGGGGRKA